MARQRIAIVFDNIVRPDTTGGYCLRALQEFHDVRHFLPDQLDQIPRTGFDLYLNIDDGLRYHLPDNLRPSAWWAIDTHMDPVWAEMKGRDFDWLFAAQRDGAESLQKAGIPAQWLPLACDPDIHMPHVRQNRWDVCFVGRNPQGLRRDLLTLVLRHFPNSFIGERYFEDFAKAYSESKIGFNRSVKNDVNMRVFETLGCGSLLVTNDLRDNGQEELFVSDEHLVTYRSEEELVDKLRFYLGHDKARERIAAAGREEVVTRHTYQHRMRSLLEVVEQGTRVVVPLDSISTGRAKLDVSPIDPMAMAQRLPSDTRTSAESGNTYVERSHPPSEQKRSLDEVDFIVKTFLRPQALLRLLRSITEFFAGAFVTIVDDGNLRESTDADSTECRALIHGNPRFTLHSLSFASGVSPGRNALIDRTTRPFLLLLDDDFCFTAETRIQLLVDRLKSDSNLGVMAGACIDVVSGQRRLRNSGGTLRLVGAMLEIHTKHWSSQSDGLREYIPQFALIRREVFENVRWQGGVGGEHYDFCLQLMHSRWKVGQDLSVVIDHYPQTETLPGYLDFRLDYAGAQQWLLRKWNLQSIVQDGKTIVKRDPDDTDDPVESSATSRRPRKDTPYFEFARPEVVALIPVAARRVLDIGCGAGRLGQLLKERQSVEITGLELQPEAARRARLKLDQVLEKDVEDANVEFPAGSFDCIVCADVLEHLREPAAVLTKIRRWLSPEGCLVVSLPNVRHYSVVSGLLDGNWTYESAGLLDNDHVRFFTRREIEKLLFRQGFDVASLIPKPGPGHAEWVAAGRPGSVKAGSLHIAGLTPEDAEEFFTYQYLVVARPVVPAQAPLLSQSSGTGLTSIIIVTFNELGYTKECVDSIRLRTDEPYELIFIDNSSTDGTPAYLESLDDVRIVCNADNRGFPAAVNQGIRLARGNQILLLNNDTVVSTGWLRRMLRALEGDSRIGLVGPCSNRVSSSQEIATTYTEMTSMDGFAWDWGKRHSGSTEDADRLIGFCLLIRRAVLEQIGGLDERFGIGCFEDDDICLRALRAGWRAVVARDAFVHHYGGRTFIASKIDFTGLMRENQRKFREKWQAPVSPPSTKSSDRKFSIAEAEGGGLLLVPVKQTRLSLCMIVRNNEQTIGPCLESIRPWVDEMIVVDTGSTDKTPKICAELGARVFHWAWRDDFSAARNESLKHAAGDWLFWMDSDDTISPECGRRLRQLADGEHLSEVLGYVVQVHCPGSGDDSRDVTAVDHVKLIRNRQDLQFEHRIHEQILPAIRRAGGEVAFTDIHVVHSGADHTPEGRRRKLERDFKLLDLDLAERPDHQFVLFNLGMTCADCGRHEEAVRWLSRCLEVSKPEESHVRKAYALSVSSLMQMKDLQSAQAVCLRGQALFPDDKELLFRGAMAAHEFGDLHEAERLYREVLQASTAGRYFASVDLGISGFKARHNLAVVFEDQGRLDLAEREWRIILDENPNYIPARIGLVECLLRRSEIAEATERIESLRCDAAGAAQGIRLAARLAESSNDIAAAVKELEAGLQRFGDDTGLLREFARLLHGSGNHAAALTQLERLTLLVPDDPSAWHNRGVVLGLLDRNEDARGAFSHSAALRSSPRLGTKDS